MPDVSRSGSALIQNTSGYDTQSLEQAKFTVTNGTASVNITQVGGASGYAEGTTVGTITGNALVFRNSGGTMTTVQSGGSALPVTLDTLIGGEDLTNNVMGNLQKPVASSTYAPSQHTNFGAAAGTGVLIKASAGNVYAFDVTSATAAVRYFQLFNQGTVPVVGQTPIASYPIGSVPAGGISRLQVSSVDLAPSLYHSTGIAAAISSTSGTLGTASITAADYSWHIKYV
jgi:hypothetical protein